MHRGWLRHSAGFGHNQPVVDSVLLPLGRPLYCESCLIVYESVPDQRSASISKAHRSELIAFDHQRIQYVLDFPNVVATLDRLSGLIEKFFGI